MKLLDNVVLYLEMSAGEDIGTDEVITKCEDSIQLIGFG